MRVLFVEPDHVEAPLGGAEVQARQTKTQLERLGIQIDLRPTSQVRQCYQYDLVHIFNLYFYQTAWTAYEIAEQAGVPIVLSPIMWDLTDYLFSKAARWHRFAWWMGKRGSHLLYRVRHRLRSLLEPDWRIQRRILAGAMAVLPNSHAEVQFLRSFFLLKDIDRRVFVIPNGVDHTLYDPMPQPNTSFCGEHGIHDFVLQVGRVEEGKNQLGLIRAMMDIPMPIIFVGRQHDQRYYDHCAGLARKRGNVIFVDHIAHEALPGIYAAASVHVLPSWRETPGLASLEAAAAGCRVVTTSIGCAREYFGDQVWYCHPDDIQSIRQAVINALDAPTSSQLRDHVLANYTWVKAAEATLDVYRHVLVHERARR